MGSRFTAATQYGAAGLGAGRFAGPELPADTPAGDLAGNSPVPSPRMARPARSRPVDDPVFWLVASIGAVVGLAAVAAR